MNFLAKLFNSASPAELSPAEGDPVRVAQVEALLEELRPLFRADGGDIHLLRVTTEGEVSVRLVGACGSCSLSGLTLRGAVEPLLKKRLDWFQALHAG